MSDVAARSHDGAKLMTVLDAPARAAVPTDFPDSPLSQALRQP